MKAATRKGLLGFTYVISNDQSQPKFKATSKQNQNDVLIKVHAAAINPIDYKLPKFALGDVIGKDFCGTIVEVGCNVNDDKSDDITKFQVGDFVFGNSKLGSIAEYTVASSNAIGKAPEGWKATECAALPVAYQSALQCLKKGNIVDASDKKTVVVFGASGGCGIAGLQLCKALGVSRIVGVCSKKNAEFCLGHGATEIVDYSNSDEMEAFYSENKGKVDCIYDAASNPSTGVSYLNDQVLDLLKLDDSNKVIGKFTALNGSGSQWGRAACGMEKDNQHLIMMTPSTRDLNLIGELLNKTAARPPLNKMTFDEKGLEEGFALLKSQRTRGKIVFEVEQE